jgi:hypothetical protein
MLLKEAFNLLFAALWKQRTVIKRRLLIMAYYVHICNVIIYSYLCIYSEGTISLYF